MSSPDTWMPFFVGRYLADTGHLTVAAHGAYLLLLMHYWCNGPLPDDDRQLATIARTDRRAWLKDIAPVVRPFFRLIDGRLHQKRADIELARANEISAKRRGAAMTRHYGGDTTTPSPSSPATHSEENNGQHRTPNGTLRSRRLAAARAKGQHTEEEWLALLWACDGRCLKCGDNTGITKDHIVPIYAEGSDAIDNIQPLCHRCNAQKGPDQTDLRPPDWRSKCNAYAQHLHSTCSANGGVLHMPPPVPSPSNLNNLLEEEKKRAREPRANPSEIRRLAADAVAAIKASKAPYTPGIAYQTAALSGGPVRPKPAYLTRDQIAASRRQTIRRVQ